MFSSMSESGAVYGSWTSWSVCSNSCGGSQTRSRECWYGDCRGPYIDTHRCGSVCLQNHQGRKRAGECYDSSGVQITDVTIINVMENGPIWVSIGVLLTL